MMHPSIIPPEYLICPNCKNNLVFSDDSYLCLGCKSKFAIEDGIIDFLPETLESNKLNEERIWAEWENFNLMKIKSHEIRQFLEEILPMYDVGGKLLEVGAGSCWPSALIKRAYPDTIVFASDVSKSGLRRGMGISKSLKSNIDFFVACDSERLPFKDGLFDHVFGNAVLHHFFDTQRGISEIHRVLKNGGLYVGSGEFMANRILKEIWGSKFGKPGKREIKEGILENCFTYNEWLRFFYAVGFKHVEIQQNKKIRYKCRRTGFNYFYYLIVSGIPKFFVKVFLASDIGIIAMK